MSTQGWLAGRKKGLFPALDGSLLLGCCRDRWASCLTLALAPHHSFPCPDALKVYVGNIPPDTSVDEIRDTFKGFGRVRSTGCVHDVLAASAAALPAWWWESGRGPGHPHGFGLGEQPLLIKLGVGTVAAMWRVEYTCPPAHEKSVLQRASLLVGRLSRRPCNRTLNTEASFPSHRRSSRSCGWLPNNVLTLTAATTDSLLLLCACLQVIQILLARDKATGQPKGSAYIWFQRRRDADLASECWGSSRRVFLHCCGCWAVQRRCDADLASECWEGFFRAGGQ